MKTYDIKKLRKKMELSQQQFAALVGVSVKTVSNWENGGVIPASKKPQLQSLYESGLGLSSGVYQSTQKGDNLKDSVKIEGGSDRWFDMMERKDEQLKKKDDQIAKRDDQIDRLLAIIERMQGV